MTRLDYSSPSTAPRSRPINLRMIVFSVVVLLMVGYPLYIYIDSEVSGGVKSVAGGYKEVDLKAMSSFDLDQVNGQLQDIPQRWRELNGQKVILYGEIWAPGTASPQINQFDLCYSIAKCCFSGPPLVQHFVKSTVTNGAVPFYGGLVKVTGTLHVDLKPGEGRVGSVYQLDVDSVERAG